MPTSPCAASRLGTVAASAVYGQSETMTLESKLSASCSHLVRAWRLAYAQRKESISALSLLRKMGLEPTRCTHHKILSLARLPVPTLPLISAMCDRRCRRWDLNPHYVAITGTWSLRVCHSATPANKCYFISYRKKCQPINQKYLFNKKEIEKKWRIINVDPVCSSIGQTGFTILLSFRYLQV